MTLCSVCERPVFVAEQLLYQEKIYHKPCFKCQYCEIKLNLNTVRSFNNQPYCFKHSPQNRKSMQLDYYERKNDDQTIHNNPTKHLSLPITINSRSDILGTGHALYQYQIELAGQAFRVDRSTREKILSTFDEFNIIVCGSPRAGKSTLINSICGRSLAKTDPGLDSCTTEISPYKFTGECVIDGERSQYTYNIWDTPGFETWNEDDIRTNFRNILTKPKSAALCMIFCASPVAFAETKQLKWMLDICIREWHIFCALVVTNKYAGQKEQRLAVLNKYKELLSEYHAKTKGDDDSVTFFGNVGLCTMVNSQRYEDVEQEIDKCEEGVNELIKGIMMGLEDEAKVFHWCMAVIERKGLINNMKETMMTVANTAMTYAINIKDFLVSFF